ncbi:hypothetical protein BH20ACT24_BH20ACT24_06410 [soil metagenome]
MSVVSPTAALAWRRALEAWAIPEAILDKAPESPWGFPVELFARRAEHAATRSTPSNARALEALPVSGSVLDVGCGAGAASMPLTGRAKALVGVDPSPAMLEAFLRQAGAAGVDVEIVEGTWPDASARTPSADVVVCHHVVYNVAPLPTFVRALTEHGRQRVILELTAEHPLSADNDLWLRFHGLRRPTGPTADDAVAVLREAGVHPEREDWVSESVAGFSRREDLVAWIRRRLCLPPERDPEVDEALSGRIVEREGGFGFPPRDVVTLWWDRSKTEGTVPPAEHDR